MNNSGRFWRGLFIIFFLLALCGGLALPAIEGTPAHAAPLRQAACASTTITQWDFASDLTPSTGSGTFVAVPNLSTPSVAGGTVSISNWPLALDLSTSYVDLHVPTSGRTSIQIALDYNSAANGPVTLELHYSTDGTTFTAFGLPITLTSDATFHPLSFDLSAIIGLNDSANAAFRIYAYGATDLAATLQFDNITFTGNCIPLPLAVIINEVGWAGTGTSASPHAGDEWIELHNPGSTNVILNGWRLTDNNDINIALSGTIPTMGYFVLGKSAAIFTDVTVNQTFSGSLNNNGEILELLGPNDEQVDTANIARIPGSGWPAGIASPTYASMERRGVIADSDAAWATYAGISPTAHDRSGNPVQGTPGQANWILTATTIAITADTPDSSGVNENVTISVSVTGGSSTPTGTVTITGADTNCPPITLNSSGTGSCQINFASVGTKTIIATYSGDGSHSASVDTESHTVVTTATTTTTITADTPDPSLVNGNVTVSVTVAGGASTPTGTVAISGTSTTGCTITLAAGTGSCTLKFTSSGTKTITATYSGDSTHTASTDTESHQVNTPTSTPRPTPTKIRTRTPTPAPPPPLIAINEFVPRPGHDWNLDGVVNVDDEYIELLNHGVIDVNLSGYSLDDEANIGSPPYRLPAITLKPGERMVFYGSETGLRLSDGGDGVRLLKPNGQLGDAYNYFVVRFPDQSYCRLPDNGGLDDWNQNCFPTPGLQNSLSGSTVNPPTTGGPETLCPISDTLPQDFVFAECLPFGANIWNRAYWDKFGWFDEKYLPESPGKWPVFVD